MCRCVSAHTGVRESQVKTKENRMAPGPMARKRGTQGPALSPDDPIESPCAAPEQCCSTDLSAVTEMAFVCTVQHDVH